MGQSYQSWSEAAARPCGGGAVVVDPDGAAAVDAATMATARARQRSAGRARGRVSRRGGKCARDAYHGSSWRRYRERRVGRRYRRGGITGYGVRTMNPPVIGGAGEERDVLINGGKNFLILRVGRHSQVAKQTDEPKIIHTLVFLVVGDNLMYQHQIISITFKY